MTMLNYLYQQNTLIWVSESYKHKWKVDGFILGYKAVIYHIGMVKGTQHSDFSKVAEECGLEPNKFDTKEDAFDWCDTVLLFWDGNPDDKWFINKCYKSHKDIIIYMENPNERAK